MSQKLPPSRTAPQFVIRFPDEEMRDRIREEAEKNGRSMNAEIIQRLQDSFSTYQVSSSRIDHSANESSSSAISAAFFDQDFKTEIQKAIEKMAKNTLSQIAKDLKKQLDEQREKDIDDFHKLASKSFSDIAEEELERIDAHIDVEKEAPKKRP